MGKIKRYVRNKTKQFLPGNNPDFMIIGAQKCGTTSLHNYLNQHPQLIGASPKEIHYFDVFFNHGYSIDWYKKHFTFRGCKQNLFFESSPSYLYRKLVPERIKSVYPNTKFIVILRKPEERAYSAWNMYRALYENNEIGSVSKEFRPGVPNNLYQLLFVGRSEFPSFREAIDLELELINNNLTNQEEPAILRRGLYAEQLKWWFEVFNKEQFLILGFQDLVDDLPGTLIEIWKFLQIKNIQASSINKEAKNRRKYVANISASDRAFLKAFYAQPNIDLLQLLGYQINW